ncbi:diguanylate cyclase/phosphodiesterase (GGDEF & EAL domains) with PAS/PAC sensor(s) (plasmid) [Euzebya pacifica]|uniref:Diguanylate cyclase/phosphodiesterase (GGDEF & EAL domains) with PAS/PAC sensor(S) n=1 Tax=Euzebya pacifica TaxID=1608957 RepID=A0A346Y5Q0_9ACTN|nr:GGDEF domain-containing phosphodiesterase [Euzebya pacifica]AXV09797.1 diguanylate cyclase/phosphodiesterase (GGDEF & EAL domains) with PAS/PAC sensor(s) [Euzebya pacifica]
MSTSAARPDTDGRSDAAVITPAADADTTASDAAADGPDHVMRYVWAVVAMAVIAAVGVLVHSSTHGLWGSDDSILALVLVGAMLWVEIQPLDLLKSRDSSVHTLSAAYIVALLLVVPGYTAALLVAAASLAADLLKTDPIKSVFNAAMLLLSSIAALAVFRAVDAQMLGAGADADPVLVVGLIGASWVFNIVNVVLMSGLLAILQEMSFVAVFRRDVFETWTTDWMLVLLGPVMVVIGRTQPLLLPMAMLLTWVVHHSAKVALARELDAIQDPLTGLLNRRAFDEQAEAIIERAGRTSGRVALYLIDLNDFKTINDTLGHQIGDEVLVQIAKRLTDATPEGGLVARLGGDEFAVLLPSVAGLDAAGDQAGVLADAMAGDLPVTDPAVETVTTSGSVGVAVTGPNWRTLGEAFRAADAAMYTAKRSADRWTMADPDLADPTHHLESLREAINSPEMSLVYQPMIDTRTGLVMGFEALARWDSPLHGPIAPSEFVRDIEAAGSLVGPFTRRVLHDALSAQPQLEAENSGPIIVHVNVSRRSLTDPAFASMVLQALTQHNVPADRLAIEITETAAIKETEASVRVLGELRHLGVRIALDDFGTGNSSLAVLQHLPLTSLKVDRQFVSRISDANGEALLATVVAFGRLHQLTVVAEGVEDRAIISTLERLGFDQAQGHGICRPQDLKASVAWLSGRASIDPTGAVTVHEIDVDQHNN